MYCFTPWKRSSHGAEPNLPAGLSFRVVASPGPDADWCLVSLSASLESVPRGAQLVSSSLRLLLLSAEAFPPALALASAELDRRGESHWAPEGITEFYSTALRRHLRRQPTAGYFLAESRCEEPGYLDPGEFVWILRLRRDPTSRRLLALWVSGDFSIYENPASDFRITKAARELLSAAQGKRGTG